MNKLRFSDNTEMEVFGVSCAGNILKIKVPGTGLDTLVSTFKDQAKLSPLRYFEDNALLRGYAGYTKFGSMEYTPNVLQEIDYAVEDVTTDEWLPRSPCRHCYGGPGKGSCSFPCGCED